MVADYIEVSKNVKGSGEKFYRILYFIFLALLYREGVRINLLSNIELIFAI